jgi:glutamate synthase domain-containing protein 2
MATPLKAILLPFSPRFILLTISVFATAYFAGLGLTEPQFSGWSTLLLIVSGSLTAIGIRDLVQTKHSILRNYPIAAHLRFILENIRPEMRQYFFEADKEGAPFPRDKRAIVYQRAKRELDKRPFGTQYDVYDSKFEWLQHSLAPHEPPDHPFRISIGNETCLQPYSASIFNISAMSYGALSANAIRALNRGAKLGGFAHDTGEGGVSCYHKEFGGDLIWEIGSGYFGCRKTNGKFCADQFAATAADPQIKMIELKLSQGAKPGHGGVLPGAKVTAEIAKIRSVPQGRDCISPARHSAFSTPLELIQFLSELRRLAGGKPVGIKLCVGHPWELLAMIKAMREVGDTPDFIVVDGKEGGTGAAPLEFMDHVGMPLRDGLNMVHSALTGAELRHRVKIGASGKIVSAFDMVRAMALGADWCNAARGFMFAVGCIQAQACHTDRCPTGVTTQDPTRSRAVVVTTKSDRVASFHAQTVKALAELIAAAGLDHPSKLKPHHIMHRISSDRAVSFADLYPVAAPGALLSGTADARLQAAWDIATPLSFAPASMPEITPVPMAVG